MCVGMAPVEKLEAGEIAILRSEQGLSQLDRLPLRPRVRLRHNREFGKGQRQPEEAVSDPDDWLAEQTRRAL